MSAEIPCAACGWTSELQNACRYDSHVKLFYGLADRGVWSLGSKFILKERSNQPHNFEAKNLRFLKEHTTIPVPAVVEDWDEPNGQNFSIMRRIPGDPLSAVWATMSAVERENIAKQTAGYLFQLGQLQSSRLQSVDGQPLYSAFLFPDGYGIPHGPLRSGDELWAEMEIALKNVPEKARQQLRKRLPPAAPYTFTHGNLANVNIMVMNGNVTGILDWEASGYFPVWWQYTCARIGLDQEDYEWKTLLTKYMPSYESGREFWLDFYALSKYPYLNERGGSALGKNSVFLDSGGHGFKF
ncbi:kinase-like protein [Westerdykella ornata]|uniref:Kinase-like protein n=1 Tax=Westerdykella ornata TaxID=318751 RepID=A0A6A6JUH5_WESOR|nr:kinase-like protein [Westerdykella ornata]KAF2279874.1 kinase-like protein [Westerdykella ornata]